MVNYVHLMNRTAFHWYTQIKIYKKARRNFKQTCPICHKKNYQQKKNCSKCGHNLEYSLF
ncbi:MAG: hypothetical protein ACTSR8_02185 [Promethearchaeota archaeon]